MPVNQLYSPKLLFAPTIVSPSDEVLWTWNVALDRLSRGDQARWPTLLSVAALLGPVAGAVASVGMVLRLGHRDDSPILLTPPRTDLSC